MMRSTLACTRILEFYFSDTTQCILFSFFVALVRHAAKIKYTSKDPPPGESPRGLDTGARASIDGGQAGGSADSPGSVGDGWGPCEGRDKFLTGDRVSLPQQERGKRDSRTEGPGRHNPKGIGKYGGVMYTPGMSKL